MRLLKYCFLIGAINFSVQHTTGQTTIYKYKSQIDSALKNDTNPYRFQFGAFNYSLIGEYKLDLETYDHYMLNEQMPTLSNDKVASFATYKPYPAIEYITKQAKKTRLIIINESHNHPEHRVFVNTLLEGLKKIGYSYLGLEALTYTDTLLNRRKYPIIEEWNYDDEPCFGNLIRKALVLNYYIFPYEADVKANGANREEQEAEHINAIMNKNPNSKFIIYCGYDHAIEDSTKNSWVMAMAGRVKKLSGVDPLTIDQVQLTETSNTNIDNPYRRIVHVNYDAVFINDSGQAFNIASDTKSFDVNVYHPQTIYVHGRPAWLSKNHQVSLAVAHSIKIKFPCLVFAYNSNEDIKRAVPVDIVSIESKKDDKELMLTSGQKTIKITNQIGQIQFLKYTIK